MTQTKTTFPNVDERAAGYGANSGRHIRSMLHDPYPVDTGSSTPQHDMPTAPQVASALSRHIRPRITLAEFDHRYPSSRAWRDAGFPSFGLERVNLELQALGYVPGVDYDDDYTDLGTFRQRLYRAENPEADPDAESTIALLTIADD